MSHQILYKQIGSSQGLTISLSLYNHGGIVKEYAIILSERTLIMTELTYDQIMNIHSVIVDAAGNTDGVRDSGLVEAALAAPFMTFGGEDPHPSIEEKASILCYDLIQNHCFLDGNKRIGVMSMLVFLRINGVSLSFSDKELSDLGYGIASGVLKKDDIRVWVNTHIESTTDLSTDTPKAMAIAFLNKYKEAFDELSK